MVKSQTDWNSYAAQFEPCELDAPFRGSSRPLLEVFALKFDFGGKMHADIAGTITIRERLRGAEQVLFDRPKSSFLRMSPGKLTHMGGARKECIRGTGIVEINLDLVGRSVGSLKFQPNFVFYVDEESNNEEEEDEEDEDEGEEQEDKLLPVEECFEKELYTRFELWNRGKDDLYCDKLLRKELTSAYCSIEVMYAVYQYPWVASVELTFAGWNPSYFTGKKSDACFQQDHYTAISDGLRVFGRVTAHNTLLTNPDTTTMLFAKAIDDYVVLKVGDVVPFSKSIVVFPYKSSLLLEIDLRQSFRKFLVASHKVPPSELLAKKTLEINSRHDSYCRHVIEDCGPAKFFMDVHLK